MSGRQSAHGARSNSMNPNNPQYGSSGAPSSNVSRSGSFNPQASNYNPNTGSSGSSKGGK